MLITAPTPVLKDPGDQTEVRKAFSDIARSASSSNSVVQPLSSVIGSNQTYNLINSQGFQTIYIPAQFLVSSSASLVILTLQASSSGTAIQIPLAPSGSTIRSGNLVFDVYIDSNGNASSFEWSIAASNTLGVFEQLSDGTMYCSVFTTQTVAITSPAGPLFIGTVASVNFPTTFFSPPLMLSMGSLGVWASANPGSVTTTQTGTFQVLLTGSATPTLTYPIFAIGRWKA